MTSAATEASNSLSRAEQILRWFIILGCVVRVLAIDLGNPLHQLFSDPARHWENGRLFLSPGLMGAIDPFLYQFYLFIVHKTTGNSAFGVFIWTSLLSLSLPLTWYLFARETLRSKKQALLACCLITWFPPFIVIYCYFMNETLLLPLIGISLWLTARTARTPGPGLLIATSLSWGLTAQVRLLGLPLAIISAFYLFVRVKRWHYPPIIAAAVLLLAIPQAVRSRDFLGFYAPFGYSRLNELTFISGTKATRLNIGRGESFATWEYSSPAFYIPPFHPFSEWNSDRTGIAAVKIDLNNGRTDWNSEYTRLYDATSVRHTRFFFENLVFFLFSHSWPESNRNSPIGLINLYSRWVWAPLILLNLIGCVAYLWRYRFDLAPLACLSLILMCAIQFVSVFEGRYRKPLEPLLIICTILLYDSRKKGRQVHINADSK